MTGNALCGLPGIILEYLPISKRLGVAAQIPVVDNDRKARCFQNRQWPTLLGITDDILPSLSPLSPSVD